MDREAMQAEMSRRRAARLERAERVAEIGRDLTPEQIDYLVPESELVQKLPLFPTAGGKKMSREQLDRLIEIIHRNLAAEKMLDAEAA